MKINTLIDDSSLSMNLIETVLAQQMKVMLFDAKSLKRAITQQCFKQHSVEEI